jgi:hypothetical protein
MGGPAGERIMSTRAARAVPVPTAFTCGHCGYGDHRHCPGGRCECDQQNHQPDDQLAAAMRLYQRPDLVGDTVENLAAEYRGSAA